jgi:predicted transcriptional regulator
MAGVTVKTIHNIESGSRDPSLETLGKLNLVLGMELILQVKKLQNTRV